MWQNKIQHFSEENRIHSFYNTSPTMSLIKSKVITEAIKQKNGDHGQVEKWSVETNLKMIWMLKLENKSFLIDFYKYL